MAKNRAGTGCAPGASAFVVMDVRASAVAQGLHRIEPGGAPRGIQRRDQRQGDGGDDHHGDLVGVHLGRDLGEEAHRGVPGGGEQHPLDPLDVHRDQDAQPQAAQGPDHADQRPVDEEHPHDGAGRRAHGAQDGDVARLVAHQQDQPRDDVQGRHHDDQAEDQEHDVPLHLQRPEEGSVALAPVGEEHRALGRHLEVGPHRAHRLGIVEVDLDQADIGVPVEEGLGLGERHEHEGRVELGHADLEDRLDGVALGARRRAERRRGPLGGQQVDLVAGLDAEGFGQAPADGDARAVVEALQAAALDVARDGADLVEVLAPDAAHQHAAAGAAIGRRGEGLPLHQGNRRPDPGDLRQALGQVGIVGEELVDRRDEDVAVDADDLRQQLGAEAVHHRQHDDQRGDAEGDAEEREERHHGDAAAPAPGPQVAPGDDPLEPGEGWRAPAPEPGA